MLRRTTRLSIAMLAAVIATATACSSGTTGQPSPGSTSASAQSSPAFPSESVPAGVQKDSVLDLNSTKDMTGVVTTVTFADSPYAAHLPDICQFIPDTVMKQLGVSNKTRGFDGTQLISQACDMQSLNTTGDVAYSVTINFFTNNINELVGPGKTITQQTDVPVSRQIVATTVKLPPTSPNDATFRESCQTVWGTFFGSMNVDYRTTTPETDDPCASSVKAARIIAPYMPKSPSQMRPAP